MYETPLPVDEESARQNRRYDVGGIIHRENVVIPWNLYWRDCYWSLCQKYWNTELRYVFFTGTPGVGKSVFRSFMMWWNIQRAKELKQTVIILLMKSPPGTSYVHGVYIENGELMYSFSKHNSAFKELSDEICKKGLRTICHVDVSNGDSSFSGGGIPNSVSYFYTSPNEKAWKEKLKMESDKTYVPSWSNEELYDFYLKMGGNFVLLNKLSLVRVNMDPVNSESNKEPHVLQVAPSRDLYPLYLDDAKEETRQVRVEYGEHTYVVSYDEFKRVIDNEIKEFGPIPRHLFMDSDALRLRIESCTNIIDNGDVDRLITFQQTVDAYNRILDVPLVKEDGRYVVDKVSKSKLLGTMVEDFILARMRTVLANELMGCLWEHRFDLDIDPKWYELVYLSLLSANLGYFNYYTIEKSSKGDKSCSDFKYEQVKGHDNRDIQTRRLLKPDFEKFLGNITEFGVVGYPVDSNFPVIDGARHFKYKEGECETYVTALLQVTLAKKHPSSEKFLDNMIAKINEGVDNLNIKNHRIEFWWLVPETRKTSLWPYLKETRLCERIVWPKPMSEITAQKEAKKKLSEKDKQNVVV